MALQMFCKVVDGVIIAREMKDNAASKTGGDGGPVWRPMVALGQRPVFDPATHHAPQKTEVIEPTQVVQGWAAPVAKTAQELADEQTARQDATMDRTDVPDSLEKVLLKIALLQENRLRVLESAPEITAAQFKAWVRGQL